MVVLIVASHDCIWLQDAVSAGALIAAALAASQCSTGSSSCPCFQADLWSIGTILFELLVGKPPFNGANHMQLLRNIERNDAKLPEHVAARLSGPCKSLLGLLLQRKPVERISFEEFFTHPFLSGNTGVHCCGNVCAVRTGLMTLQLAEPGATACRRTNGCNGNDSPVHHL